MPMSRLGPPKREVGVNAVNSRAGPRQNIPSPEFIHIPNVTCGAGVAQGNAARLYNTIHVIFDGNRLRPRVAGAQENLS